LNLLRNLRTVHNRHRDIRYQKVNGFLPEITLIQGIRTGLSFQDVVSQITQHLCHDPTDTLIIVDNQHRFLIGKAAS